MILLQKMHLQQYQNFLITRSNRRLVKCVCFLLRARNALRTNTETLFRLIGEDFSLSQNTIFLHIKNLTISFKTGLFLYKLKLLAMKCVTTICASALNVTKRVKLFKMAQKMHTYDENQYHKRSSLSTTGIPTEYHRNPN